MIIIDPPVGPYSEPARITEWINALKAKRRTVARAERPAIDAAIRDAEEWRTR